MKNFIILNLFITIFYLSAMEQNANLNTPTQQPSSIESIERTIRTVTSVTANNPDQKKLILPLLIQKLYKTILTEDMQKNILRYPIIQKFDTPYKNIGVHEPILVRSIQRMDATKVNVYDGLNHTTQDLSSKNPIALITFDEKNDVAISDRLPANIVNFLDDNIVAHSTKFPIITFCDKIPNKPIIYLTNQQSIRIVNTYHHMGSFSGATIQDMSIKEPMMGLIIIDEYNKVHVSDDPSFDFLTYRKE